MKLRNKDVHRSVKLEFLVLRQIMSLRASLRVVRVAVYQFLIVLVLLVLAHLLCRVVMLVQVDIYAIPNARRIHLLVYRVATLGRHHKWRGSAVNVTSATKMIQVGRT